MDLARTKAEVVRMSLNSTFDVVAMIVAKVILDLILRILRSKLVS